MPIVVSDNKELPIISGDLRLNRMTKTVHVNNEQKKITGLTYLFLETLLLANQNVVTQEELAEKVWNKRAVSDETIIQRASLLRKALGDQNKEYFESIRGVGYQWLKKIQLASPEATELRSQLSTNKRRIVVFSSVAVISIALVAMTFNLLYRSSIETNSSSEATNYQSLLFQRANQYAEQHTESSNKIAIQLYQQTIDNIGEQPKFLFAYASALIERTAKFERTDENLQRANNMIAKLEQNGGSSVSINWLKGYYFDVSGDIEKAIEYYEKSLRLKETPQARTAGSLGYLYTQKGKLFEALQLNLISLKGAGLYRLLQVAEILYLADFEPSASEWVKAAYQYAPNDAFTAVQYAEYLFVNRKIDTAEQIIFSLHALGIKSEDSLVLAAMIEISKGEWNKAERLLKQAVSIQPDSVYATSMQYWLQRKIFQAPLPESAPVLAGDSDWPNAIIASSMILLANEQNDEAITQIEKAFKHGYIDYRWLINNPIFSLLNKEARFRDVISKMMRSAKTERAKIELLEFPDLNLIMQGE